MKFVDLKRGQIIVLYTGVEKIECWVVKVLDFTPSSIFPLTVTDPRYPSMGLHRDIIKSVERATRHQRFRYYMEGPHFDQV